MVSGNNFRVRQIKKRLRCCRIGKPQCGLKGQEYYRQIKETKTLNISIVVLLGDSGKIH